LSRAALVVHLGQELAGLIDTVSARHSVQCASLRADEDSTEITVGSLPNEEPAQTFKKHVYAAVGQEASRVRDCKWPTVGAGPLRWHFAGDMRNDRATKFGGFSQELKHIAAKALGREYMPGRGAPNCGQKMSVTLREWPVGAIAVRWWSNQRGEWIIPVGNDRNVHSVGVVQGRNVAEAAKRKD
jgi:hypothetical protein